MGNSVYVLGHSAEEIARLQRQAHWLEATQAGRLLVRNRNCRKLHACTPDAVAAPHERVRAEPNKDHRRNA